MKNRIYTTATLITALSVAERALGFLYRIVLSRLLGAEGLGMYQIALSLFGFFLTFSTGGIPITVSRMITKSNAENSKKGERRAVSAGLLASALFALPAFLFFLLPNRKNLLFSDPQSFRVFKILLLGLLFSSFYAVFRGYFWGKKQLLLPAITEIAEESVMVVIGILLLQNLPSATIGAQRAAWAVVLSYLFSFTLSALCFFVKGGRLSSPIPCLKPLFNTSLPITSVRASGSLINSAVAILLPAMLIRAGASEAEAVKLFGVVSGMAIPILFIPSTLIGSIAQVLTPELSEDFYRKNYARLRKNIQKGVYVSYMIACVLIPFFIAFGKDVGLLAFANPTAGEIIYRSAFILLPISLALISTSALNALGFEKQTFVHYFIGAAALFLSLFFLPRFLGVYAYVIGLFLSFLSSAVCNLALLHKKGFLFTRHDRQGRVQRIIKPLILLFPLSFFGRLINEAFHLVFSAGLCLLVSGIVLGIISVLAYFLLQILPLRTLKIKREKDSRKKHFFCPFL